MAVCPVCRKEHIDTNICPICGFDQLGKEFLNKEDAEHWKNEVLLPFIDDNVCDLEDFLIEDGSLTEFSGEKPIVVLPSNIKRIDDDVFLECNHIKHIVLPSELNELGFAVFSDCESLTEVTIPDGITELPEQTFAGCKGLQSVVLPNGLLSIASHAFSECESLKKLHIPQNVNYIDIDAFFNCVSLTKIVIPKSVETIETNAFEGCANLEIYCEHLSKPEEWDDNWCNNGEWIIKNLRPHDAPRAVYWGDEWHYENGIPVPNDGVS